MKTKSFKDNQGKEYNGYLMRGTFEEPTGFGANAKTSYGRVWAGIYKEFDPRPFINGTRWLVVHLESGKHLKRSCFSLKEAKSLATEQWDTIAKWQTQTESKRNNR